ncbi:MAG: autotransporter outer membrane beta-barrel domain-containing protein [Planctomycetaceae bacterium]|jgi:hypothetical protein|nr:autotransporter outer membrane beta-barrel domain-containing protein [Planctomycetaceae bacterium]
MLKPSFFYVYFILFFCFGTGVANLFAANLEIGIGETVSIGSSETLGNSELYGNKGTLKITGTGSLTIAAGVVNIEPPNDGIEGLELGIVQVDDLGEILAGQTIRFQENSIINGFVSSTSKIIFDGVSTFSGNSNAKIQTDLLLFNPSENKDENGKFLPTTLDLSGGAELDIDELVANGSVNIIMKDGEELELKALTVDGSGTIFNVSEDFTVLGNYTGGAGAMLISQLDENNTSLAHGVITLLGGGELSDGTNNLIMQSGILAKELRVQNLTAIAQNLTVYGDFTVLTPENGKESITTADYAVQIVGKTTLQPDTVLHLKGESYTNMTYFGYYYYNGLFFGGLELQNGSVLQTTGTDAVLSIALGDTSEFQNGSQIIAENIHLAGVDTSGSSELQLVRNGGKLSASGLLQLTTVNFENTGNGLLEINCLKLASSAILNLTSSGSENGGLTFTGDNPYLEISANSALVAEGKTLDLTGVEIINKNPANGIEAKSLVFGSGSSLAGAGNYAADATFKENSKIKLDSSGTLDFGDHAVWLKEGAVIELTVDSQGTGSILTEGKITMDNGVLLAIADGSTYSGRTKTFRIIQGSADSVFADLAMADSLFFKLNKTILDNENGLSVEITKSADLVDYVNSANQRNLGILIDNLLNQGMFDNSQKVVFDALLQIGNDSDYQSSLDSLSGATRENMLIFALSSPWRVPMENIGFHRLPLALEDNGTGLNQTGTNSGTSEDNARTVRGQKFFKKPSWNLPKQFSPKQYLSKRDSLQRFLPKRRISHDLWADVYYNYTKLNADGNAPGGNGSRGGFYIGMGLPAPLKESIFGVSFGYSAGQYKQSLDKADLGDFQIGFYGGMNLFSRNLQLRGYIGYGVQNYEIDRNVEVGSYLPTPVSGKTDGNSISAAFYFVRPVDISESFLVKPILGFDLERLTQDGFTEDGFEGLTLTYDKTSLMRTMFRLGITGDYVFRRVELTGRFMYGLKITGENTANSNHHFQNPANIPFRVDSINLGSNLFDLGFGGNISLNRIKTTLLFLDYNTTLGENSNAHTASLGFLWKR